MPSANLKPRTLYDKVFDAHIVDEREDGTILLYIGNGPSPLMMVGMYSKFHGRQTFGP